MRLKKIKTRLDKLQQPNEIIKEFIIAFDGITKDGKDINSYDDNKYSLINISIDPRSNSNTKS